MIDGMIERFHNHLWFWRKVDMREADECWPWLAQVGNNGYGYVRVPKYLHNFKSAQTASRVAYYISNFNAPFNLMEADRAGEEPWIVHHDCENTICCNPLHLRVLPNSGHLSLHRRKKSTKCIYPNFILAYSHHLPKGVEEHKISSDEHWSWRNNV